MLPPAATKRGETRRGRGKRKKPKTQRGKRRRRNAVPNPENKKLQIHGNRLKRYPLPHHSTAAALCPRLHPPPRPGEAPSPDAPILVESRRKELGTFVQLRAGVGWCGQGLCRVRETPACRRAASCRVWFVFARAVRLQRQKCALCDARSPTADGALYVERRRRRRVVQCASMEGLMLWRLLVYLDWEMWRGFGDECGWSHRNLVYASFWRRVRMVPPTSGLRKLEGKHNLTHTLPIPNNIQAQNSTMGKAGKGTGSFGKRRNKSHSSCPRCGRRSLHLQKGVCSACGYPAARTRRYNWGYKAIRRKTTGTGRMRYMRHLPRRFKNGFREGTQAVSKKASGSD